MLSLFNAILREPTVDQLLVELELTFGLFRKKANALQLIGVGVEYGLGVTDEMNLQEAVVTKSALGAVCASALGVVAAFWLLVSIHYYDWVF